MLSYKASLLCKSSVSLFSTTTRDTFGPKLLPKKVDQNHAAASLIFDLFMWPPILV